MINNKTMILNGVRNKDYNGVLKIFNDNDCYIKLNLNIPIDENYTLVVKSDKISAYSVNLRAEALKIDRINLDNDIYAVVAVKEKGILYGGTNGDKIKAFSLLSEYRNLLDSGSFFIKESEQYVPETENRTDKTAEENIKKSKESDITFVKENKKKERKDDNDRFEKMRSIDENRELTTNEVNEIVDENTQRSNFDDLKNKYDEKLRKETREKLQNVNENFKQDNYDEAGINNISETRTDEEILEEIRRKEELHNRHVTTPTVPKEEEEEIKEQSVEKFSETKTFKKEEAELTGEDGSPLFDDNLIYKGDNFYMAIHSQIDEIFVCYPEEPALKALIPNSNWVKVEYAKNEYYVVGIIKELDEVKYICYGVPSRYDVKPPLEVKDIAKWLPLDVNEPRGKGYWLIYQDGKNGKTLTEI